MAGIKLQLYGRSRRFPNGRNRRKGADPTCIGAGLAEVSQAIRHREYQMR
jgi:hypothetical protein